MAASASENSDQPGHLHEESVEPEELIMYIFDDIQNVLCFFFSKEKCAKSYLKYNKILC